MSIARFTNDLKLERLVVLEGLRLHRQQLAQALAQHLGYRVNLGAVTSKYIGETEKNLERLFAGANHAGAILFFDEAESLFGQRSEVKDSHDRYANLETRLDTFRGQVIIGVDNKHSLPPRLLQRSKILSVNNYWPPK
jgi:hypothetical protein